MQIEKVIELYNRGVSLFPVDNTTKMPLIQWKRLQTARPSLEEVKDWFSTNNRSVGVCMGQISGLFLLDFDFATHPESRTFFETHDWPTTWEEKTKSGGRHLYFSWSPALELKKTNTTGLIHLGVDTKGQGGYAKMAPSEGYEWIVGPDDAPLANLPDWLFNLLPARESTAVMQSNWINKLVIKDGNRNQEFTRLAGSLRARGYNPDEIFFFLSGQATSVGLGENELRTICQSVGRYPAGTRSLEVSQASPEAIGQFLEAKEKIEWIAEPYIAKRTVGFIAGLPETMKTWIAMDLAVECARGGGQWLGRFSVNGARVLFVEQERFKGETQRRFAAIIAGKEISMDGLDLHIQCGTSIRLDEPLSFEKFRQDMARLRPELVIIDSFATFHSTDENHRGEIQQVLEKIKQMRTEFGCTFLFIDHESKAAFNDKYDDVSPSALRIVGSIGKIAAAEFCLTVRRQDALSSFMYHTKSTMASTGAPVLVRLRDLVEDRSQIAIEAV